MILNLISLTPEGVIFATGLVALLLMYSPPHPRLRNPINALIAGFVFVLVIDDISMENINSTTILVSLFVTIIGILLADLLLTWPKKINETHDRCLQNESKIETILHLISVSDVKKTKKRK